MQERYVIFGAGDFGRGALSFLGKDAVAFFVDNDEGKAGGEIDGVSVRLFRENVSELSRYRILLAVSPRYLSELRELLRANGLKESGNFYDMWREEMKKQITGRWDSLSCYQKAVGWLQAHTKQEANGASLIVNTETPKGYPEVTGYTIPSLLRWGCRDLAISYAKWLLSIQREDGGWNDWSGKAGYVFDTGQILKGLVAICPIYPAAKPALERGVLWLLSNKQESGRLVTPDKSQWTDGDESFELIHLYCLRPVLDAAELFHREDWKRDVADIVRYYVTRHRDTIVHFRFLSHFYAYVMEALLDLGEEDLVREAMGNLAPYQTAEGAVPAYHDVHWVCSTGLFQLALVWFRIGEVERGNKAFSYACHMQNASGGWYGSYPTVEDEANDYFPFAEISWANKYFLDALYYKGKAEFDHFAPQFFETISREDARYQLVLQTVKDACPSGGGRILDVGCGKGRYVRNLADDFPEAGYVGVDISKAVIEEKEDSRITWQEGTLTNIPFPDNSFDVVYACESLEHAVDIKSAIRELARVTKPDGRILIIDKNKDALGTMEILPWEQWFGEKELADIMGEYCDAVDVHHDVKYEGYFQKDLFSCWIGTVKQMRI